MRHAYASRYGCYPSSGDPVLYDIVYVPRWGKCFHWGSLLTNQIDRRALGLMHTSFRVEEVKQSLFSMVGTKAPRPDGMPAIFFQHY
ncbi:hypothetical protein LIER_42470 [Lithospermum erythrorhizon]|uniref:Uncharacterized protein n=1 Tax=Lithospermum erythrorhizon TaxID=34254 RepID=A0AAV3RS10_LITER